MAPGLWWTLQVQGKSNANRPDLRRVKGIRTEGKDVQWHRLVLEWLISGKRLRAKHNRRSHFSFQQDNCALQVALTKKIGFLGYDSPRRFPIISLDLFVSGERSRLLKV